MRKRSDVTRDDVLEALRLIKQEGFPDRHQGGAFELVHHRRSYPASYVVEVAARLASGGKPGPKGSRSADQGIETLRALGFDVRASEPVPAADSDLLSSSHDGGNVKQANRARPAAAPRSRAQTTPRSTRHSGRSLPAAVSAPIARIVVEAFPNEDDRHPEEQLLEGLAQLPSGSQITFLVTPGGFIDGPMPRRWTGEKSWASRPRDLKALIALAEPHVRATVTSRVLKAAANKVKAITIGVDLLQDVEVDYEEHAELVAVVDVATGDIICWTGKSFPVGWQEASLIQVADLNTHLLKYAGERVLVLGCHDLNMFSPRGRANQRAGSVRNRRCVEMESVVLKFKPTIVLQHPHTTDTPRIWSAAWSRLRKTVPTIKHWASGIRFSNRGAPVRGELTSVLQKTASDAPPPVDIFV